MSTKFRKELKILVQNKVISNTIAANISDYYDAKNAKNPTRLFTVFGVFGAVLIGAGVILMLAHNWDHLSKTLKTIIAFVPLLVSQILAVISIIKQKSITWKEVSATLLLFAIGASISLISQIYHIDGALSTYLITWIILAIPLIYLLKSHAVTIIIILINSYYALEVGLFTYKNNDTPWMYVFVLLLLIPHIVRTIKKETSQNIVTVYNWILPISILVALGNFIKEDKIAGILIYIIVFGLLYNIGKWWSFYGKQRTLRNGYLILGSLGTIIMGVLLTFNWSWDDMLYNTINNRQDVLLTITLFMFSIGLFLYNYIKFGLKRQNAFQGAFIVFVILILFQNSLGNAPVIISNILVFILGVSIIKIGSDQLSFGKLNYGILIITILLICRFFDTDLSFVWRGIVFVIAGIGFFLTNYGMLRKKNKIDKHII